MKFERRGEKNPDDMPVSREELEALGITGVSMTRGELDRHLEVKRRQSLAVGTETLAEKMGRELSDEEIDRAEQAGRRREELGR